MRISFSEIPIKSRPLNRIFPFVIFPGGDGIKRMRAVAVTLFPDPDSPTIPSVSFLFNCKFTPLTAFIVEPPLLNSTVKFSTSSKRSVMTPPPSIKLSFSDLMHRAIHPLKG
ncbi:hypothetical protein D9M71_741000 [compost metagenome]